MQVVKKIVSIAGSFLVMGVMVVAYQNCSSSSEFSSSLAKSAAVQVKASDFNINGAPVSRTELEGTSVSFSAPAGAIPQPGVICDGGVTYQHIMGTQNISGATGAVHTIPSIALSDAGPYFLDVTNCGVTNRVGPINLEVVPVLYVQDSDLGNKSLPEGSDTNFFVTAAGPSNISYQWYFTPENALMRQALSGQEQAVLQLGNISEADQGSYELEITGSQSGIDQTLSAGPAFLDVFQIVTPPVASVVISAISPVIEGDAISILSQINGGETSNQTYQWLFNGQDISGEISSNLTIDPASLEDAGVYQLIVSEQGSAVSSNFLSINIECAAGLANVNGECKDITPPLVPITIGINGPNAAPEGSDADFTSFLSGLEGATFQWLFNGEEISGETTAQLLLENLTIGDSGGYQLKATKDNVMHQSNIINLTVQCTDSKILMNGMCVEVMPATVNLSGNGFLNEGGTLNLTCSALNFENPVYEWFLNGDVLPGEVSEDLTVSDVSPEDMGLYSCRVSDAEADITAQGISVTVSCLDGNVINNGQCVPVSRTCQTTDGLATGFELLLQNGTYSECIAQGCNDPAKYILVNGQCVTKTGDCSDEIENGSGSFTINSAGESSTCMVTSCDAGYVVSSANVCIKQFESCPIHNGIGVLENTSNGPGLCKVDTCNDGFVNIAGTNTCVPNKQACSVLGGVGEAQVTSSGVGTCVADECFTPYELNSGQCVLNTGSCNVANGTGNFGIDSEGVYKCIASSCNAPYELRNNTCVLPDGVCSSVPNGTGVLAGTNTDGSPICVASSCNEGYKIENGQCVLDLGLCSVSNGQGMEFLENGQIVCRAISCDTHFTVSSDQRSCDFVGGACNLANGTAELVNQGMLVMCKPTGCDPGYELLAGTCVPKDTSCTPTKYGVGHLTYIENKPPRCVFDRCMKSFVPVGDKCVFKPVGCNYANGITGLTYYDYKSQKEMCRPTKCVTPGKVLYKKQDGTYACKGVIPPPQPPKLSDIRIRTIFRRGSSRPSVAWNTMTSLTSAQKRILQDGVTDIGYKKALRYVENNLGYFAWKFDKPKVIKTVTMYPSNDRGHSLHYHWGTRPPDMSVYVSNNGTEWTKLKDVTSGARNKPVIIQFNEEGRAYRYVQISTNFNSDYKINYTTEIKLSEDGLLCSPGAVKSCSGGREKTCNAQGSAYGSCVAKPKLSFPWLRNTNNNGCQFTGRNAGDQCENDDQGNIIGPSHHGGR